MQWKWCVQARRPSARGRWVWLFGLMTLASGCAARWDLNYDYGVERAKKINLPLLLYFKDWSSPEHRNMVVSVFENSTVAKELNQSVNIELLYNWGPPAKRYNTTQTPGVFVFCRPDGTEVDRLVVGKETITPQRFAEWLRDCRAKIKGTATQPAG